MVDIYAAMNYISPNHRPMAPASASPPTPLNHPHMSGPTATSRAQSGYHPVRMKPDRPGKFPGLEGFVNNPPPDCDDYGDVYTDMPYPGNIIHITEKNEGGYPYGVRLDQRVMLVIRPASNCAMTCIPLCRHGAHRPETEEIHWNVLQDTDGFEADTRPTTPATGVAVAASSVAASDESRTLLIKLDDDNQTLKPGITVNLTELWHVEYDHLSFKIIGHVSPHNWEPIVDKVAALFVSSLKTVLPRASPVPGIEVVPEPDPEPGRERERSVKKERDSGEHKRHRYSGHYRRDRHGNRESIRSR